MTNQQWEEILLMQKAFRRLYGSSTSGLVAISDSYVQITYDVFLEMFGGTEHETRDMKGFKEHSLTLPDRTEVIALERI